MDDTPEVKSPAEESGMLDTLSVVVEHTPVAIAMFDRQMRYILANRQWIKEFNLGHALPLAGKSQYEVFPKLHPGWRRLYERALQGFTMRSDHSVTAGAGGAPVLFRCEARPWRHKHDASVAGIVVTCNKYPVPAAEGQESAGGSAAATQAETLFDIAAAELPVLALDAQGRVLEANPRAAELCHGRGLEEGVSTLWELLEEGPRQEVLREDFAAAASRLENGHGAPPQVLTVKPAPSAPGGNGDKPMPPCRWLLARHGAGSAQFLALGLSGLSPFEAVAVEPAEKAAPDDGGAAEGAAELARLRQENAQLQAEVRTLREVEHKLARRDSQQHVLAEALPAGVLVLDEYGRVSQQNKALKALLGHEVGPEDTVESWLGRACPDAAHREEVGRIWREDVWRRQLTRTVSLVTADGLLKEIEMRPASLGQGGLLVHFQDVTESCRLDEQLSALESKFRVLLQESPLPVVIADKAGAVYEVNAAAEALFQKAKPELRRLPVDALLSAESAAARRDALREMRHSGGHSNRLRVQLAGPDAPKMNLTLGVIPAADGGVHSTLHFFETPVAWAGAPAAGAAAGAQPDPAQPVLNLDLQPAAPPQTQPLLLLSANAGGRIDVWTDAAVTVFGHTAESVRGQPLHVFFKPSNPTGFYETDLPQAVRAGAAKWDFSTRDRGRQNGDFLLRCEGSGAGARLELWLPAAPQPEAPPAPVAAAPSDPQSSLPPQPEWGLAGLGREQVLLAEMHHRVHHQLNILSSLVNVQCNGSGDATVREALRSTQNRLRAVAALHQHLENLATRSNESFADFVDGLIASLQSSLEVSPARVHVRAEIPADVKLPREWLMPLALTLNETLSNALEHGFPDGREGQVTARLEVEGNRAVLSVEDEGIGMGDAPSTASERGMGLKFVSVFATQMRGQLKISSTPGKGTRIELQFFIAYTDN